MSSQVQKGGKRNGRIINATILFRNYHNTIFCIKKEISFCPYLSFNGGSYMNGQHKEHN